MNILITGANGQLGRAMRDASAADADNTYFFTDIAELDITNPEAVKEFVETNGIDLIVNCAAYTDVNRAESDREKAYELNTVAPGFLADAVGKRGGGIIHISTDYVFGGTFVVTPCDESMPEAPLGVYGSTKLEGETEIIAVNSRHIIIRTAWLYSETGKNFVRTMLDLTSRLPEVKVVIDQVGTPTYAPDLAAAIMAIILQRGWESAPGVYHFSDEGICSWYDLARRVAVTAGHSDCRVLPCRSSEYPSPVERPAYSVLDKTKIKRTFGVKVPYWTDSLDRCIANLLNL